MNYALVKFLVVNSVNVFAIWGGTQLLQGLVFSDLLRKQ